MPDETEIQKLLRLKRFEQPPAGYHEKFLQDFHRRQRSDMLQQPMWKIAMERMSAFFSEHSMGQFAYAAATAAVLIFAGVASYDMLNGGNSGTGSSSAPSTLAVNTPAPASHPVADSSSPQEMITLGQPVAQPPLNNLPEPRTAQISNPHYVIDSRPVSYERQFSF